MKIISGLVHVIYGVHFFFDVAMDVIIHFFVSAIARFCHISTQLISFTCLTILFLELFEKLLLRIQSLLNELTLLLLIISDSFLQFLGLHLLNDLGFRSFKKNLIFIHEGVNFLVVQLGKVWGIYLFFQFTVLQRNYFMGQPDIIALFDDPGGPIAPLRLKRLCCMLNDIEVAILHRATRFSRVKRVISPKPPSNRNRLWNRCHLHLSNLVRRAISLVERVLERVALAGSQWCLIVLFRRRWRRRPWAIGLILIKRLIVLPLVKIDVLCPTVFISTFMNLRAINASIVWRLIRSARPRRLNLFNFFELDFPLVVFRCFLVKCNV